MELFGYHRKAAIRVLRAQTTAPAAPALILSRPREYHPNTLVSILKQLGIRKQLAYLTDLTDAQ